MPTASDMPDRSLGRGPSTARSARLTPEWVSNWSTPSFAVSRKYAWLLTSKLVVCEETQIKPGSTQANALKTFITDPFVLVERKGFEAERARQTCCFVFTSNFAPTWMEEGERRYYVMDVDHDGRSGGANADGFATLVGQVHQFLDDPANVGRLYNALMQRQLPEGFSAKSLNIAQLSTPIMQRLQQTSRQTIVDQLEELLNERGLVVLPEADVVQFPPWRCRCFAQSRVPRSRVQIPYGARRHLRDRKIWSDATGDAEKAGGTHQCNFLPGAGFGAPKTPTG
ncbi:primase-helicase family protein [Pseudophaeobacter sp.]|uniref:primase-helicase family protein n=1 Tax=Pseudophaeobacter sp. TaxID=1971739 RepID=UPI0026293E3E|nr:primase-helicase family protein [Pseudophaeobacter sp.]